ncbi:MAG TPA: hypothetical protein VMU17_00965 [Elusimicrobiota bacterium]|nr:hypothetical protein [Elusimicrobiota bacterium]
MSFRIEFIARRFLAAVVALALLLDPALAQARLAIPERASPPSAMPEQQAIVAAVTQMLRPYHVAERIQTVVQTRTMRGRRERAEEANALLVRWNIAPTLVIGSGIALVKVLHGALAPDFAAFVVASAIGVGWGLHESWHLLFGWLAWSQESLQADAYRYDRPSKPRWRGISVETDTRGLAWRMLVRSAFLTSAGVAVPWLLAVNDSPATPQDQIGCSIVLLLNAISLVPVQHLFGSRRAPHPSDGDYLWSDLEVLIRARSADRNDQRAAVAPVPRPDLPAPAAPRPPLRRRRTARRPAATAAASPPAPTGSARKPASGPAIRAYHKERWVIKEEPWNPGAFSSASRSYMLGPEKIRIAQGDTIPIGMVMEVSLADGPRIIVRPPGNPNDIVFQGWNFDRLVAQNFRPTPKPPPAPKGGTPPGWMILIPAAAAAVKHWHPFAQAPVEATMMGLGSWLLFIGNPLLVLAIGLFQRDQHPPEPAPQPVLPRRMGWLRARTPLGFHPRNRPAAMLAAAA